MENLIDFELEDLEENIDETVVGPYEPIRVEELLDEMNELPRKTRSTVASATRHIQEYAAKNKDADGRGLADDLIEARENPTGEMATAVEKKIDTLIVSDWQRSARVSLTGEELRWVRARVHDNLLGAGAVEPLRRDPRVTEILVAAPQAHEAKTLNGTAFTGGTRVEIHGQGLMDAPGVVFANDDDVLLLVYNLLQKQPTIADPLMSATLRDGSRLETAHRVATDGEHSFVAIRRHPEIAWTLKRLIDQGTISEEMAVDLAQYVRMRLNIILSGGTGSGKTSTLNALLGFIDTKYHLAVIEDTKEINTPSSLYSSRRVSRPPSIGIREHLRASLRSRPDIILVGEVRGTEALDMLKAMNTGHEGSMSTCHANSAHDTVLRLETMISETGEVSESAATHAISSSVDLIIYQARMLDGSRKITGIYEVIKPDLAATRRVEHVELRPLWVYDYETGQHTKVNEVSSELLAARPFANGDVPMTLEKVNEIAALTDDA